ncbi:MAG: hypothetical protein ACI8ZX_000883 [Planctomycetota bacterium]|jgi:hypothetical protein
MKNYLFLIVTILLIGSCAKQEEIVLEKDSSQNGEFNYFYVDDNRDYYYDSQNNEDRQYFGVNSSSNYNYYVYIGNVQLDRSYIYGNWGGYYDSYSERVSAKKDKENVRFQITEGHKDVYPTSSSNYEYDVTVSEYELYLLKPNMTINQTWTTSQDVTRSYEGRYSYYPAISDETTNSLFEYQVIEIDGAREINNNYYSNLVTIRVVYNMGPYSNLTRTYTFSDGVGLVAYTIQAKVFELE